MRPKEVLFPPSKAALQQVPGSGELIKMETTDCLYKEGWGQFWCFGDGFQSRISSPRSIASDGNEGGVLGKCQDLCPSSPGRAFFFFFFNNRKHTTLKRSIWNQF